MSGTPSRDKNSTPPSAAPPAAAAPAAAPPASAAAAAPERADHRLAAVARRASALARKLRAESRTAPALADLAEGAHALVADLEDLRLELHDLLADAADPAPLLDRFVRLHACATEDEVLEQALDATIAVTGALRGFVVTLDGGLPTVRAARNLDATHLPERERELSHSILDDALRTGETVLVPNALIDSRYARSGVVQKRGLLSVLVVPLRIDGAVGGAVYVDHDRDEAMFTPALLARIGRYVEIIASALGQARRLERLDRENRALLAQVRPRAGFEAVIGSSPAMVELIDRAQQFAQSPWPVLLVGEPGTGKELLARAIHQASPRRARTFLTLNMSAIPETLVEDTLFGHEPGAFAEARTGRKGYFEEAAGGTLFLDEIGDAPAALQAKLLRAVQFGEIQRLGSDAPRRVDVRLIAATNHDLEAAARAGRFRSDLLYRLNPLTLRVPPLRERVHDLPLLVRHLLQRHEAEVGKSGVRIDERALARLLAWDYAGSNVRALENFVKYMLAIADGDVLTERHLPPELFPSARPAEAAGANTGRSEPATYEELEAARHKCRDDLDRSFIERAVAAAGGNVLQAAAVTRTDRRWFYARAKQLGLRLGALRRQ